MSICISFLLVWISIRNMFEPTKSSGNAKEKKRKMKKKRELENKRQKECRDTINTF